MEIIATYFTIINTGLLCGIFFKLGDLTNRVKQLEEWRTTHA